MSGKAIRRRAKLVKAANQGNLAKAQRGRASANLPLPSAPTKDDYVEKVPASLRRMMALKAAATQPPAKKQNVDQQQQQQQQQNFSPADGPPSQQDSKSSQKHKAAAAGGAAGAAPAAAAAAAAANSSGMIWEQPKKLKQRKKDYLNAKNLKKKGKRPNTDQELDVDMPAFGEVVHAPPKVHLKRKHWDPAASKAAQEQQQHQQAGARLQQQQQRPKQKQQQAPAVKRQKQAQDPALLELREQAIEGYRAGRGPRERHATLGTLKQLVK